MSELRNEISKTTIRGELNLLYSMSKLIVTIMDQATYVHEKICKYTSEIKESCALGTDHS